MELEDLVQRRTQKQNLEFYCLGHLDANTTPEDFDGSFHLGVPKFRRERSKYNPG